MKNILKNIMIGVLFCFATTFAAPAIWNGTVDASWYYGHGSSQTFTIYTAEQLAGLAEIVNEGYATFRGKTIFLGADIFLNDTTGAGAGTWGETSHRNWVPIGTKDLPFKGVFDGSAGTGNHRIYGLYINSTSDGYAGLFGNTDSAKITNLDIPVGKVSSKKFVGALVGYAYYGEISNTHINAEINSSGGSAGGLVGGGFCTIIDSYFEGNVTGTNNVGGLAGHASKIIGSHSSGMITGSDFVGGLTGDGGTVENSHFKGDVNGVNRVGGLVGQGSVTNSHSEGNVTGTNNVGGLCGGGCSSVTGSHFEGNVIGTDSVGGLVGLGSVTNSYSIGTVTGNNYVGGLAGKTNYYPTNAGAFSNSYFQGKVVASKNFVGGLVGLAVHDNPVKELVLENSYVIADVEGFDYVGGLIGCDSVAVRFSGQKIHISNSYSQGDVRGNSHIGGIIGKSSTNEAAKKLGYESNIVACHHSGNVVGDSDYVGGIIGRNDAYRGNIDSSFHDDGKISGINYVGGLIGFYDSLSILTNSYSEGNISGLGAYVGGLAGRIENLGLLNNSYSRGNITGTGSYVGGICGYSQGDSVDYVNHLSGNVNGEDYVGGLFGWGHFENVNHSHHAGGDINGIKYVGGLFGHSSSNSAKKIYIIKNSYSVANVHSDSDYVGGIVGYLSYTEVDSAYHNGNINGGKSYVGGLVGYCYGYESDAVVKIHNSHAIGDYVKGVGLYVGGLVGKAHTCNIDSSYYDGDNVQSASGGYVGGLVGSGYTISNSYSTADVSGSNGVGGLAGNSSGSVNSSYALGDVSGSNSVGGLVGSGSNASISKSWANGNVFGNTEVGGLVGSFTTSYHFGKSISDSYVNGNVTGNTYVGGLVGKGEAIGDTRDCPSNAINRNYVSGSVNVNDEAESSSGCIFGYMSADSSKWGVCGWNLDKSYYDSDKCNLGVYGEFHGHGYLNGVKSQAKTTAEMQIQTTFEQWNFSDIWTISENSYPYHRKFANYLSNADVVTGSLSDIMYDGQPKMPQVKSVHLLEHELTEGVDYIVEYKHNLNAGIARIKVCGINAYSGCKIIKFEITPAPINLTIASIENMVYTGIELTPNITVYNGESLVDSSNYTIKYADNLNAGTASVLVNMNGNYVGTATATFTIEKAYPIISHNPKASDVLIGESLALSELSDGISNVEGLFVWKVPEVIPTLENEGYAVQFIPMDTANYNSVEMTVPVKVWDVAYVAVHIGERTLDSVVVVKGTDYSLPIVPDSAGYDFAGFFQGDSAIGFSGDVVSVSENTVIDAKYSIKIFAVNFVNDGTELQSDSLPYGSLPEYIGSTPIKAATAQYTYTFKGWSPAIETVSKSATYTAVFDSVVNKYVITFVNGNTELQSSEVEYGTMPTPPTVTLPENTAQYTYSFGGWDKDVVAVTGAATYTATIDSVVNKYLITFKNGSEVIQSDSVAYGIIPERPTITLPKNTAQYTYSLSWDKDVVAVTGAATYTATIDSVVNKYDIVFKDYNGTVLKDSIYAYGTLASKIAKPTDPTRATTAKYVFSFKGWSPSIDDVTEDAVYTAVYDSTVRSYTITFKNGSDTMQSSEIEYGVTPSYKGTTPTKTSTKEYTYTFKGWNPAVASVVGSATYTAVFDSTIRKYTVTFMDGDVKMQESNVAYGSTPVYSGNTPTKAATDSCTYKFSGWNSELKPVTGDVTYTAKFEVVKKTFLVHFVYGNNTYQLVKVEYGEIPKYTGNTPAKKSTKTYAYEFVGWSPEIGPITKETYYTAVFDSSKVTGIQNVRLANLNVSVNVVSRNIQISAAPVGSGYAIFDMQGRVLKKGRVESPNFNIMMPRAGTYFVKVGSLVQRINIK